MYIKVVLFEFGENIVPLRVSNYIPGFIENIMLSLPTAEAKMEKAQARQM